MWHIEFKAKDKKDAASQLKDKSADQFLPSGIMESVSAAIDALPKPIKGQGIFVQTIGHSHQGEDHAGYSASMSVSICPSDPD